MDDLNRSWGPANYRISFINRGERGEASLIYEVIFKLEKAGSPKKCGEKGLLHGLFYQLFEIIL